MQLTFSNGKGTGLTQPAGSFAEIQRFSDTYSNIGLALPILAQFNFPFRRIRPYVAGGTVIQYNIKNTEERTYQLVTVNNEYGYATREMKDFTPASIGMQVNVGFEIPFGSKLSHFYEIKWQPYFTQIGQSSGADISFKALTLSAGVLF